MTMHRRGFFKGLLASARLSVAPMSRGEVAEIALAAVRADEAKRTAGAVVAMRRIAAQAHETLMSQLSAGGHAARRVGRLHDGGGAA